MSTEPHADDRPRPNVSGDLPTVLQAAPMFRRHVVGYDRFQVDTYVQWAEDELATAERERERLLARHVATQAALDDAQRVLSHSAGGGEFLRVSDHIGTLLAAAADQAESMRAEAEADRSAASALAERMVADAEAEAERVVAEAGLLAGQMAAGARRTVARAEQTENKARATAVARLEQVRVVEQRAAAEAAQLREQALAGVSAARAQARDDVLRMLAIGRDERRRADDAAVANRKRLDREADTRRAQLLREIADLEHRRAVLRAEAARMARALADQGRMVRPVPLLDRLRWRHRTLRAP
jgi:cell division septum initiation protein DivIVA